jgi:rhodanese-related sulfurtransferase
VSRGRVALAGGCVAVLLCGCLGTGTRRIDAACREMRSTVAYEMLKDNPTIRLVDLRRPSEVSTEEGRLPNAKEIPLEKLPTRIKELGESTRGTIVVFGRVGEEGRRGCQFLASSGYEYVIFISDGAEGWFTNGRPGARPATTTGP